MYVIWFLATYILYVDDDNGNDGNSHRNNYDDDDYQYGAGYYAVIITGIVGGLLVVIGIPLCICFVCGLISYTKGMQVCEYVCTCIYVCACVCSHVTCILYVYGL